MSELNGQDVHDGREAVLQFFQSGDIDKMFKDKDAGMRLINYEYAKAVLLDLFLSGVRYERERQEAKNVNMLRQLRDAMR